MTSLNIFELQPVLENKFSGDVSITSLECVGNNVYVGTNLGAIISYSTKETEENGITNIESQEWAQAQLYRDAHQSIPLTEPITQLYIATALNRLIALCAGNIFVMTVENLTLLGAAKTTKIISFSVNSEPPVEDPFRVEFCVAQRTKKIIVFHLTTETVESVGEIPCEGHPIAVTMNATSICLATQDHYYIYDCIKGVMHSLFPIKASDRQKPIITVVSRGEYLMMAMLGLGVFVNSNGVSQRAPILWEPTDGVVLSLTKQYPYIVSLCETGIRIHSLHDQKLQQRITLDDGKLCLDLTGQLMLATSHSVYQIKRIDWKIQVSALIGECRIDDALTILRYTIEHQNLRSEDEAFCDRIKLLSAFLYIEQHRYDDAKMLLIEEQVDVNLIIDLCDDINFDCRRETITEEIATKLSEIKESTDKNQLRIFIYQFLADVVNCDWTAMDRNVIQTSMLKLAPFVHKNDKRLIDALNSIFQDDLHSNLDEIRDFYQQRNFVWPAFLLSLHQQDWPNVFEIGKQLYQQGDMTFVRTEKLFDVLSKEEFHFADVKCHLPWLYQLDNNLTINIMKSIDQSEITFDDLIEVLPPKTACASFIEYAEWRIKVKQEQNFKFHNEIARCYVAELDRIFLDPRLSKSEVSSKIEQVDVQKRLRHFIQSNHHFDVDWLVTELKKRPYLTAERAFLLCKTGSHTQAMSVLLDELNDIDAAEQYCVEHAAHATSQSTRQLYGILVKHLTKMIQINPTDLLLLAMFNRVGTHADLEYFLETSPDEIPIACVKRVLQVGLTRQHSLDVNQRLTLAVAQSTEHEVEKRLKQLSRKSFTIDHNSVCAICKDSFVEDASNIAFYPFSGAVVHRTCMRYKHLCPASNECRFIERSLDDFKLPTYTEL